MARGELPADEHARKIAIATKYAIAHKGILLTREKEHLKILGIGLEKYTEIVFLAGQIHANNMLAVFMINEVIFIIITVFTEFSSPANSNWDFLEGQFSFVSPVIRDHP